MLKRKYLLCTIIVLLAYFFHVFCVFDSFCIVGLRPTTFRPPHHSDCISAGKPEEMIVVIIQKTSIACCFSFCREKAQRWMTQTNTTTCVCSFIASHALQCALSSPSRTLFYHALYVIFKFGKIPTKSGCLAILVFFKYFHGYCLFVCQMSLNYYLLSPFLFPLPFPPLCDPSHFFVTWIILIQGIPVEQLLR
jgi:hypothetical protein